MAIVQYDTGDSVRKLFNALVIELDLTLDGGCDHSVGICECSVRTLLHEAKLALDAWPPRWASIDLRILRRPDKARDGVRLAPSRPLPPHLRRRLDRPATVDPLHRIPATPTHERGDQMNALDNGDIDRLLAIGRLATDIDWQARGIYNGSLRDSMRALARAITREVDAVAATLAPPVK
jgi:hypothetical protein